MHLMPCDQSYAAGWTADMVIMGLKRFNNQELTSIIKAAGTLQFDDDMLLDRTSQQLMLSVHRMSATDLYNLVSLASLFRPVDCVLLCADYASKHYAMRKLARHCTHVTT